jgi:hypothetical protein
LLALSLLLAPTAQGQDSTARLSNARRIWPIVGLRAGTPATVSAAFGAAYARRSDFVGPFISIEPGLSAGRASMGLSLLTGNLAAGPIVRGSVLRRYRGDSQGNYVGVELQYVVVFLGPRIGLFRSTKTGNPNLFTADFGFGF